MPKTKAIADGKDKAGPVPTEKRPTLQSAKTSGPQRLQRAMMPAIGSATAMAAGTGASAAPPGAPGRARTMGALQRAVGNAWLSRMAAAPSTPGRVADANAKRLPIQAKLTVGPADDPFEREADQAAGRIAVGQAVGKISRLPAGRLATQRKCAACAEEEGKVARCTGAPVQRATAGSAESGLDTERAESAMARAGPGSPLAPAMRMTMEEGFGADFSGVRVHTGPAADEASRAVNARAFTRGSDIYLARDERPADRRLMGHELAHTVQQGEGQRERVQRYSWDEFVNDVEGVGESIREGVSEAGEAIAGGARAVGEAAVSGAEAVGEAVVSGVEAVGGAVDWVLTEAGQAALAAAEWLVGNVGGHVTVGPAGLVIEVPEIALFDPFEQDIIPPTPRSYVPLLGAGTEVGPFILVGTIGIPIGLPTLKAFLGPGRLQNIRIRIDPRASTYSTQGEIYVGAALNMYEQTGIAARVDALTMLPTEPPIPFTASLEGGLLATFQASYIGAILRSGRLAYTEGTISFDLRHVLSLGIIGEIDLSAYLNAQIYEIEICEFIWPIEHWETSGAIAIALPISLSYSRGAISVTIGPIEASPIPIGSIETALERYVPETHCTDLEEFVEELCEREILPPNVCEALDSAPEQVEVLKKGCKHNPGDCTAARCEQLQDEVNKRCKGPKFACKLGESCNTTKSKMRRAENCAKAREKINQECYRGGDQEHRDAAENARRAQENCRQLIRDNCR